MEDVETDGASKDEKAKSTDMTVGEDEALGANGSQGDDDIKKDELTVAGCDSVAAPGAEPESDLETHMGEGSAVETVMETAEENKDASASTARNHETPAGEEAKTSRSDGDAASQEAAMPELPKVQFPGCVEKFINLQY